MRRSPTSHCLAKGDPTCTYFVTWKPPPRRGVRTFRQAPERSSRQARWRLSAAWPTVAIAAGIGATLGGVIGALSNRLHRDRASRTLEKHRIAALERGLSLRGEGSAAPGDLTGTVLGGKYRISNKIGSGGIGVVYAAEHIALGHEVAVKVLRGAAARDASEIARLRREAQSRSTSTSQRRAACSISIRCLTESIYVVMELLHGDRSPTSSRASGIIAPGFALPVFIGVCRALARRAQEGGRSSRSQAGQHLPLRRRHAEGARLRHEQARRRRERSRRRATRSARPSTWRPSSASARTSRRGPTSTRSASSCTKR